MSSVDKNYTAQLAQCVDQICLPLYQQTFENVAKRQPDYLTDVEGTILNDNLRQVSWYEGDRRAEVIERIRRSLLRWFNTWLTEHNACQPPYIEWKHNFLAIILDLTNLLFRIDLDDVITSNETRHDCQQIAANVKSILTTISQANPNMINPAAIPFVRTLLQTLFYLTVDNDLAIYIKSFDLVDLMNTLLQTSNNDHEIHLQVYRILAVIMTENDIKQLKNAQRIAVIFIGVINDVIDRGTSAEGRLHNSLRSLKVLTQHDEIREELIKQNGQRLLLRCAMESHFNPLKAKLPALDILLALAFNKDFASTLKNNTDFMNHLRTLTSSPEEKLQRVATALIWKLEKESEISIQQAKEQTSITLPSQSSKKQYDIMISYSHSDKDLCDRLLNTLEKDQYHVWIDSQLMHGATFDAMAEAIENAEFVFICMSDAYKQSPFCKMEASYAVKRRCNIIPLVMTSNYKADGWLGVLTSALIYVDFPKVGFEKAYQALKKQVQLIRTSEENSTVAKQDQVQHNPLSIIDSVSKPVLTSLKPREPRPVVEYPHCIDNWTEEHVKSFLLDKQLDVLLPVLEGMNGQILHQAYSMCQANQHGMYLSWKEDVNRSGNGTLPLKDYLIFLKEIGFYVPITIGNQLNPTSAICNLM